MRRQIRKSLHSSLFYAILSSGLVAGLGSVLAGVILFHGYLERSVAAQAEEAVRKAQSFEAAMSVALALGRRQGRKALEVLGARYPDMARASSATMASLRSQAEELGVDEIYLVGADGKVFATSFAPDQGLDLYGFTPQFTSYLKGMLGTGREFDMEISGSTQTGNINNYQYYGPLSGELVVEVSTRMGRLVSEAYPGYSYKDFLALFFAEGYPEKRRPPVMVEDYVDVSTGLSQLKENVEYPQVRERWPAGASGAGLSWREGMSRVILVPASLGLFWSADNQTAILMRIDESYYYGFAIVSAALALAAVLAASLVSFLGARHLIDRAFTRRIEALEAAMEKVGRGDSGAILEDGRDDELSSIGRSAALMVGTIRKDAAELRAFARQLEEEISERQKRESELADSLEANRELLREVNHRVKNNLQLLVSLVRLETDRMPDEEAASALSRMESRMRGLALVEDQLVSNPSLARIDMDKLLEDLAQDVLQSHPSALGRVAVECSSHGSSLPSDDAIAVSLASRELLDNACRHAFPGDLRGLIHLSLRNGADGGYELVVRDNGIGAPRPLVEGLGIVIARAVLAQREVRLDFPSESCGFMARAASASLPR